LQEELANTDAITLQRLALETGVHPVTISKHFPRYFNCTLSVYIRKLRVQKAIGMLKANDTTLKGIAYACGFSDQSHFIRCFKTYTGFLPKDFRKS
jgi:AraC family transcriptional regulator